VAIRATTMGFTQAAAAVDLAQATAVVDTGAELGRE